MADSGGYSTKLFAPQRIDPRSGQAGLVRLDARAQSVLDAEAVSVLRLWNVGMAVEGDDRCPGRRTARHEEHVHGKWRYALPLEGADPALWPPVDLACAEHRESLELLRALGEEWRFRRIVLLLEELLVDGVGGAGLEPEAGGVAYKRHPTEDTLVELDPVADDAEVPWTVVEELVERSHGR